MKPVRKLLAGLSVLAVVGLVAACADETEPIVSPEDNPPTIQLTAPNGGEVVQPGSNVEITWTATDDIGVVGVDLSYLSGGFEAAIATGLTGSSYTWQVPDANVFSVTVKAVAKDTVGQTGEDESDNIFAIIANSARGYVGSSICRNCHFSYSEGMLNSGHPYKLNEVVNGQAPEYPHSEVPTPPPGALRAAWSDIAYVIGGYGWKALFLTADSGWIMTNAMDGVDVQYNLPRSDLGGGLPAEWAPYQTTDAARKPYDCGACHTTGWQSFADNGGVHQDGLVGIAGTWEETGITCEECHGPGANHVASQSASDISVDDSGVLCNQCHVRGDAQTVSASGGFVTNEQQYNELLAGPHADLGCNDCHDAHVGVLYGNAANGGIVETCESCHPDQAANNSHNSAPDCVDCHMSRATMSARAVHSFEGDVRTHIFRINADGNLTKDDMFNAGGTFMDKGWVTLDFACYSCHTDPVSTDGGGFSQKTMAELAAKAAGIHN
ncbi:MAG: hypothetical protein AMS18_14450 [Gemmatimonas sp. SG8_17]|nr:MAG: hypothetical protein AMS18_14450 [Gemmatimonas sp. SG8_17]